MILRMDRRAIRWIWIPALLLSWTGTAHSQLYTVHETRARLNIASENCNGSCRIHYERMNSAKLIRWFCGLEDGESIPNGFTLATFLSCDEPPEAVLGVWDRQDEQPVCDYLDFEAIAGIDQETGEFRGKAEYLYGALGPPLFVTAKGKYAPLPRRFDIEQICWQKFKTHSVAGALAEDVVVTEGKIRAGNPIAVYVND